MEKKNADHNYKSSCDSPRKTLSIQPGPFENLEVPGERSRVALIECSQRKHRQFSLDRGSTNPVWDPIS